jgi:iron complex outermembrane receptor protein
VLLFISSGNIASAQDDAPQADDAESSAQTEILVTARKREESLVQVPVAITSLSGSALAARGVVNFNELSNFAPGFKYQDQSVGRNDRGFQTFIMRGMNPGSDAAERASATIFIEGVPAAGGAIAGLTDVERVEVVPGPQSALFGRSTFSGAVNFITRSPGFDWKAGGDLSYSSYGTVEGKASIEGPIVPDLLAVRVSGRYYSTDGQYRNPISGGRLGAQKTKSISGAFTFTPSSALKMKGAATAWRDSDGAPASGLLYAPDYNCNAGAGAAGTLNYVCGSIPSKTARLGANVDIPQSVVQSTINGIPGANIVSADFIDHIGLERKAWQASLGAEYDLGNDYALNALYGHSDNKWAILADTASRDTTDIPHPLYGSVPGVLPYGCLCLCPVDAGFRLCGSAPVNAVVE